MDTFYDVINTIIEDENKSILELGHHHGTNFNKLKFKDKVSVDIRAYERGTQPTYLMPSDKFFEQNNRKFDIVYIDANHVIDAVVGDYTNAINCLDKNGLIFFHDLIPINEWFCIPTLCGDGFKLLNYFIENNFDFASSREDMGLTCVFNPAHVAPPIKNINYADFMEKIKGHPRVFVSDKDFLRYLRGRFNPSCTGSA